MRPKVGDAAWRLDTVASIRGSLESDVVKVKREQARGEGRKSARSGKVLTNAFGAFDVCHTRDRYRVSVVLDSPTTTTLTSRQMWITHTRELEYYQIIQSVGQCYAYRGIFFAQIETMD